MVKQEQQVHKVNKAFKVQPVPKENKVFKVHRVSKV